MSGCLLGVSLARQQTLDSTPMTNREIAWDRRFFVGDRPCVWHKRTGVVCTCDHYECVEERVLIIKLDAMGDVLRSTAMFDY
jgi:hypothetical protein